MIQLTPDEYALFEMQMEQHCPDVYADDVAFVDAMYELEDLKGAYESGDDTEVVRAALWYGWTHGMFDCAVKDGQLVFAHKHAEAA